jgi:hypothetical protein
MERVKIKDGIDYAGLGVDAGLGIDLGIGRDTPRIVRTCIR